MASSKVLNAFLAAVFLAGQGVLSSHQFHGRPVVPTIEGPITGGTHGHPFGSWLGDISDIGYVEEEYFISGNAQRYAVVGELTPDGFWTIQPNGTSPYKTRILVRRPANRKDFNGDVILEWINVSSGYDLMISDSNGVYEAGYAFVGVSAQLVGLDGFQGAGVVKQGLTQWDPERYGSLHIEDENVSYDIFTQAVNVLKSGKVPGLQPKHVLAVGESQSGIRLAAYANGVQPLANSVDMIFSLINGGMASDFNPDVARPGASAPSRAIPTKIRTDLDIPVHQICTETEALNNYLDGTRQDDTDKYRYWEVAGGSHANKLVLDKIIAYATRDNVTAATAPANLDIVSWLPPVDAAYQHGSAWVRGMGQPGRFPRFEIAPPSGNSNASSLARDQYGNVIGGARQPEVLVPITTNNGEANSLLGTSVPFNATTLHELYGNNQNYVAKVRAACHKAVSEGLILSIRAQQLIKMAKEVRIPSSKM
ncbi:hypothetical protein TrVFT333_003384 [Trichoderma virens FT-333]|nr:hypothetical protein TrVFT333_003384 [Trichoderma virens FT-333]